MYSGKLVVLMTPSPPDESRDAHDIDEKLIEGIRGYLDTIGKDATTTIPVANGIEADVSRGDSFIKMLIRALDEDRTIIAEVRTASSKTPGAVRLFQEIQAGEPDDKPWLSVTWKGPDQYIEAKLGIFKYARHVGWAWADLRE